MRAMGKSMKPPAANVLRSMGPKPVLSEDIEKLDKTFGNVLSPGKLSHQFYTVNGGDNISSSLWMQT